ncbi:NADH-quinone oxidoreductase subunit D, partial [Streptomyces sp. MCAF7]
AGGWGTVLFVLVSALTGGAVLRAGLRVFLGLGTRPPDAPEETTGEAEEPESQGGPLFRIPDSMLAVPAVLLAGSLAVGLVPGLRAGVGHAADTFTDHHGYLVSVLYGRPTQPAPAPAPHWTAVGLLWGLLATALAAALALRAT